MTSKVKPQIAVPLLREHLGSFTLISMEVTESTIEIFKTLVSQSDPEQLAGPGPGPHENSTEAVIAQPIIIISDV